MDSLPVTREEITLLMRRLQELEARVRELEDPDPAIGTASAEAEVVPEPGYPDHSPANEHPPVINMGLFAGVSAARTLSYTGRTLIILGGGFLLRAITEAGILGRPVGTTLALVYGLVWILLADRVARHEKTLSAFLYGLVGILIIIPVLTEATLKYHYWPVTASILGVSVTALGVLVVAWRGRLAALGWVAILAAVGAGFTLALKANGLIVAGLCFDALGVATLWIAYSRKWFSLAWITAFFVDLLILVILVLVIVLADAESRLGLTPVGVIGVQFAAVVAYLGTIATRTLIRHRDVLVFEILQSMVLLIFWLGSALKLAPSVGAGITPLGAGCIALAAGCYGVAFTLVDRRVGGRRNFIFYTSLAIVFAVFGGGVLLEATPRALLFVILAFLTTGFSLRYSRITLFGHSVFYLLTASFGSGLFLVAGRAFWGTELGLGPWVSFPVLMVLISCVAISLAPVATRTRTWGMLAHLPRLLLYGLVTICLSGLFVALLGALPMFADATASTGVLASFRTIALALCVLILGTLGKRAGVVEATWLAYAVLVLAGIKLAVEDLPAGRALTMFVSLGTYGAVLILVSRMLRRNG